LDHHIKRMRVQDHLAIGKYELDVLAVLTDPESGLARHSDRAPEVVMGVVGKRAKYRLGKNAEA